jgi:phenylacetic acid degradation protein
MPKVFSLDGIVPVVDPTAFVHPGAVLIGDVIIGPDCYVGPGASIRADVGQIVMARGSNFQDNCSAHCFAGGRTEIQEYASIGHGAVLHGCTVGARAIIGMNAVVMDGAVVGDDCIVAALAFVRANFEAPARTIVAGLPAKVLRDITEAEIEWKKSAYTDYLNTIPRCKATLQEVDALTAIDDLSPRITIAGAKTLSDFRKKP